MNNLWKKILQILLLIWPYLIIPFLQLNGEGDTAGKALMGIYSILTVVVFAANIVSAWSSKDDDCYKATLGGMLIKLFHIPFYLLVFCVGALMLCTVVIPGVGFMAPFVVFYLFLVDVFLMITSSMYGASAIVRAGKQGLVSKGWAIVNLLMHFLFVTDVISAVIVFVKMRKLRKRIRKI